MTFDQAQDEIERNTEAALVLYRRWDGWRDEEIWIADAVEWLIRGEDSYDSLPGKQEREARCQSSLPSGLITSAPSFLPFSVINHLTHSPHRKAVFTRFRQNNSYLTRHTERA